MLLLTSSANSAVEVKEIETKPGSISAFSERSILSLASPLDEDEDDDEDFLEVEDEVEDI